MICCLALASEITLGAFLISTLISLHKIMFVPVVIFGSGAWDNVTTSQMVNLLTVQLKFLKRIVHTPASTSNCFTFLELGVLPVEFSIRINQLQFLHHILQLTDEDPVKVCYYQQSLFQYEKNWFNEVQNLRKQFGIDHTDDEIMNISKEGWKTVVHSKVRNFALKCSNIEMSQQSKTSHLPPFQCFKTQDYFNFLSTADARLFFAVRSGTVDIKSLRKYNYDDGDTLCRLCGGADETLEHIINQCDMVNRSNIIEDIFSVKKDSAMEVISRLKHFQKSSEDLMRDCCD